MEPFCLLLQSSSAYSSWSSTRLKPETSNSTVSPTSMAGTQALGPPSLPPRHFGWKLG